MGVTSPSRRTETHDVTSLILRLGHYQTLKLPKMGVRPNDFMGMNAPRRNYVHVTSSVGHTLGSIRSISIVLRGATKRKSCLNSQFRRLTLIVRHIRSSTHINIYVSATRLCNTNFSVTSPRIFTHAFSSFSGVVKFKHLHKVRFGSALIGYNSRISERTPVNSNILK